MWLDFTMKTDSAHERDRMTEKRGTCLAATVMLGHVEGSCLEFQ